MRECEVGTQRVLREGEPREGCTFCRFLGGLISTTWISSSASADSASSWPLAAAERERPIPLRVPRLYSSSPRPEGRPNRRGLDPLDPAESPADPGAGRFAPAASPEVPVRGRFRLDSEACGEARPRK